jgi:hypothetical protein
VLCRASECATKWMSLAESLPKGLMSSMKPPFSSAVAGRDEESYDVLHGISIGDLSEAKVLDGS